MTHERHEHEPLVEAWLKEPTFVPAADLARVSVAIAQTPQRRDRHFRLPTLRFQTMLDATKAATAVAILGISGALLVTQLGSNGPGTDEAPAAAVETPTTTPAPTAAAPTTAPETTTAVETTGAGIITLPDQLPEGVTSGTIETPEGPARWAHVPAELQGLHEGGQLLPWTDGVAYFTAAGRLGERSRGSLLVSTDGVMWKEPPMSDAVRMVIDREPTTSVVVLEGVPYVIAAHPARMWRLGADEEWQPIDTSATRAALPMGWMRTYSAAIRAAVVDGQPTIVIKHWYRLPRKKLDLPNDPTVMHRFDDQRYGMCRRHSRDCTLENAKRVLRFKETGNGVVVHDDRTDERLGLLKGASIDELYEGGVGSTKQAYEVQGANLVETNPPPAGWADRQLGTPPEAPNVEFDVDVFHGGATWAAAGRTWGFAGPPWLFLGGEWTAPTEFGFVDGDTGAWNYAGVGNANLIWTRDDGSSDTGLTIVESPSAS